MKKKLAVFVGVLMSLLTLLPACNAAEEGPCVRIDYGTGMAADGSYDRDMYFSNRQELLGADPGAIYVPEERDPVYGGYYYMYVTGWKVGETASRESVTYAYNCARSKDLVNWEPAGAYDGAALKISSTDWAGWDFWAPDIVYDEDSGLYYMYYSASIKKALNHYDNALVPNTTKNLGIAVGTSPVDFQPLGATGTVVNADGQTINRSRSYLDLTAAFHVQDETGNPLPFAAIDPQLFVDDDGSKYLYFVKESDKNPATSDLRGIWGMKMKDYITPDYSTLAYLAKPSRTEAKGGYDEEKGGVWQEIAGKAYDFLEGNVNEGPYMLKYAGKYYLTYSGTGYTDPSYSVHQAIGTTPLGTFTKPQYGEGNPIMYPTGSYVAGTAHHCFLPAGDELMILYHRHANSVNYGDGMARMISVDRAQFIYKEGVGYVLAANGPTFDALQWKPESVSGYKNHAKTAKITVSNGTGARFLNDGLLPSAAFVEDRQYFSTGATEITLSWDTPVSIDNIMVYNCTDEAYAFSNISEIKFYFAEQPAWATKQYAYGVIENLAFPDRYVSTSMGMVRYSAAAIADFDTIKVNKITLRIQDKYEQYDAMGDPVASIGVSEIVVLGK